MLVKQVTYDSLSLIERKALEEASEAMEGAYNPYSRYYVGAALYSADGKIVSGSNVENAAYTSICAERSAVVRANAMGLRLFQGIAVISRGEDFDTEEVVTPCGFCRQV